MNKLSILVLDEYRDELIRRLHKLGVMEVSDLTDRITNNSPLLSSFQDDGRLMEINTAIARVGRIIDILDSNERKRVFNASLFSRKKIIKTGDDDYLDVKAEAEDLFEKIENEVISLSNHLNELNKKETELKENLSFLNKLKDFDFDLSYCGGFRYTGVVLGEIESRRLYKLQVDLPDASFLIRKGRIERSIKKSRKSAVKTPITVLYLKSEEEGVLETLRNHGFEKFKFEGLSGKPKDIIREYERLMRDIVLQRREIRSKLNRISLEWRNKLIGARGRLHVAKEKREILSFLGKTDKTYFIEGWVPKSKSDYVVNQLYLTTDGYAAIKASDPTEEDNVPTLLNNPPIIKTFEYITKMYATPGYNEIDPTFILAFTFPLFFGICFSDAAYGLLLLASSAILYLISRNMRDLSKIFIISSIPAIILGLATGSIFGNLLQEMFKYEIPAIINVFGKNDAKLLLGGSILIGMVHVNLGVILAVIENIRLKKYSENTDKINLLLIEASIITILMNKAFFNSAIILKSTLLILAVCLIIRVRLYGPFSILDISSLFGNFASYARLFALMLTTAALTLAIHRLVGLLLFFKMSVLAFILLVIGHLFCFILNILGSFIQPLRLHYVEFFSKFYQGNGREFAPFKMKEEVI